jgi:hypothetical protein
MWTYFTEKQTFIWFDVLDDFVIAYNNSYHSSIGMKPIEVREEKNASDVWDNLYGMQLKGKAKYKLGDHVRISK